MDGSPTSRLAGDGDDDDDRQGRNDVGLEKERGCDGSGRHGNWQKFFFPATCAWRLEQYDSGFSFSLRPAAFPSSMRKRGRLSRGNSISPVFTGRINSLLESGT
ncbi:hypothetical protein GUJ93_ZPchr0006g43706 [Zizania palustris]|uniref:Uncharacterized protein n=1 Tax=Zizania palustris TaxID=103762 RepID=A0A8J5TE95_ZIZPA|nr:hypothetical protein GUJ93_ZPchr0006g43706 [Zizania palustris]